jgi:hypothetical protein
MRSPSSYGFFHQVSLDRFRTIRREIEKRASELDRSSMNWLLRELDEDDMHTFLSGLPGQIISPLLDTKLVVEGLRERTMSSPSSHYV